MTKREAAVIMAYTGDVTLIGEDFRIYHEYVEQILGRPVYTHEMADKDVMDEIREKSKADFIDICRNAIDDSYLSKEKVDGCVIIKKEASDES